MARFALRTHASFARLMAGSLIAFASLGPVGCGGGSDDPAVDSGVVDATTVDGSAADGRADGRVVDGQVGDGSVASALLTFDRSMHDFGMVTIGQPAGTTMFMVTNSGTAASGALAVSFTGTDAAQFTASTNTCTGQVLAPGGSCALALRFLPTASGAKSATLTVTGGPAPISASLSGTAILANVLLTNPSMQDFGSVVVNEQSASFVFEISNSNAMTTGALATAVQGTDASSFLFTSNTCQGAALTQTGRCTIGVRFAPTTLGNKSAFIGVLGIPGGILSIPLAGRSVEPGAVRLSPPSFAFDPAVAGTLSNEFTFMAANTGGAATGALTVSVTDTTNFALVQHDCMALAAAATCNIRVRFNPTTAGTKLTSLQISGTPGGTAVSSLTGVGLTPAMFVATPTSQDFQSIAIGSQSATQQFLITNTGAATSGVPSVTLADEVNFTLVGSSCTQVLGSGASCTVDVRFNPTGAPGAVLSSFTVTGTPGGAAVVELTGTGLAPGEFAITPMTSSFGSLPVGMISAPQTFTITNGGQTTTGVPSAMLSDTANYSIVSTTCSAPLAQSQFCEAIVRFHPTTVGNKIDSLVATAAPGGVVASALSGVGTTTLSVSKNGAGSGTVTSSVGGISCGATCSAVVSSPTVTLTATPASGSDFVAWSGGGCSGSSTCIVPMTQAQSVTATFQLQTAFLTVNRVGAGTVTSSPAGISCGANCSNGFTRNTSVTLTAVADVSTTFTGWTASGFGGCSGTGTCQVTMDVAKAVTATFTVKSVNLTTGTSGSGSGAVTLSPAGTSCGTGCANYDYGTQVTITAAPATGSNFTSFAGCTAVGNSCTVTMDGAKIVTAQFTLQTYNVQVTKTGAGSGTVAFVPTGTSCGTDCMTYNYGQSVVVNATAQSGSNFAGWSGHGCNAGVCALTIDAAKSITATFTLNQYPLTVVKTGMGSGTVTSNTGGLNCGITCTRNYDYNSMVTLTATAATGSTFAGWSGAGCSGTGVCVATIDSAKTATANFTLIDYTIGVTLAGTGSGSVVGNIGSGSSNPLNCGSTCSLIAHYGDVVTLDATRAMNSNAANTTWSAGGCSAGQQCVLSVSGNANVTVTFTINPALLTISDGATYTYPEALVEDTKSKTFTVTNTGASAATSWGGFTTNNLGLAAPYTLTGGTCNSIGASLAPTGTCTLIVAYAPVSAGQSSDSIDISYNGGNSTASRAIAGTAVHAQRIWGLGNGLLKTSAMIGEFLYIGGDFFEVFAPQDGIAVLDKTTGNYPAGMARATMRTNGDVRTVIADGNGGWYLGGAFTQVGGVMRNRIAHQLSDGTIDPNFNPNCDGDVYSMVRNGQTLYIGGNFTHCDGSTRNYFAALNTANGALVLGTPGADATVRAMLLDGNTLYVGGSFSTFGGGSKGGLAAVDVTNWSVSAFDATANGPVLALGKVNSMLFVGGLFTVIGGGSRSNLAVLDLNTTGSLYNWNTSADNMVFAIATDGPTVYVGGSFISVNGVAREKFAALDTAMESVSAVEIPLHSGDVAALHVDGSVLHIGGAFAQHGSNVDPSPLYVAYDMQSGIAVAENQAQWSGSTAVWALATSGSKVVLGGSFQTLGRQVRGSGAAFNLRTGDLLNWDPQADGQIRSMVSDGPELYLGGSFTTIQGAARLRLAKVSGSTGAPVGWTANVSSGSVSSLALYENSLIVGGSFNGGTVSGSNRNYLTSVSLSNGLAGWNPLPNGPVNVLHVNGNTLYVGGQFTDIDGETVTNLYAFNDDNGPFTHSGWAPDPDGVVNAIATSGSTVYIGGNFANIGGGARQDLAAVSASSGLLTTWNPNIVSSGINSIAIRGSILYAGANAVYSSNGGTARIGTTGFFTNQDTNNYSGFTAGFYGSTQGLHIQTYYGSVLSEGGGPNCWGACTSDPASGATR